MDSETRITPDRAVLVGALLAAFAYIQDVRYDFILDDVPLILMNELITSWQNWKKLFVVDIFASKNPLPAGGTAIHYRPIYQLWQMLNEQLFGSVLPWWHVTSLLLHIAATFLVYQLGVKLLKERWTAALGALLFAFHPIHAESVAYVTASTDLLVTVFSLAAFLAYFRFREEKGSVVFWIASVALAALAIFSKETAVMFPGMLVAYEALRQTPAEGERIWKQLVWTLPFFAVVGAYLAVRTALFGFNTGPGPGPNHLKPFLDIPLVLLTYLRNLLWPNRLSFFYPAEWTSRWTVLKGAAVVLVILALVFLWKRYRDRSGVRLQIVWMAICFVPALLSVYAFVQEDWIHDRHMYLVSVPLCLFVAAVLTDRAWPRKAAIIASSAVMAALLLDLAFQVPKFRDNTTLYESALKVAPRSLLAHGFYGEALWGYGRYEDGLREFQIMTELSPRSAGAHERYGAALAQLGRDDEALSEFEQALRRADRSPLRAFVLSEMAEIELKRSEFRQAADQMREAVQLAPRTLNYHALLAQALSGQGESAEADQEMRLETAIRREFVENQRTSRN